MRQQINITISLSIFLFTAVIVKYWYYPDLPGTSAYYFLSVFWICGILIIVMLLNMIWRLHFRNRQHQSSASPSGWVNRRNTFRIIYPAFARPKLVVETADDSPVRHLEFPVLDLSQGGSCFLDDGSLGDMQRLSGYIRLSDGDRIRIASKLIRKTGTQVSLQFSHTIEWSTLLDEQRRVLALMKSAQ